MAGIGRMKIRRVAIRQRLWLALTVIAIACAAGFLAGCGYARLRSPSSRGGDLALALEAWRSLQAYYCGPTPPATELAYGAIEGSLATLHDPYTRLVRPAANQIEQDSLRGRFGGIGAYVYQKDGAIWLRPLPDSPASRAGIREGDRLIAVDGRTLPEDATTDQVVALVRGPVGSTVNITIERAGIQLSFAIVRADIPQPTVQWQMMPYKGLPVGYVRISLFSERTASELDQALADLRGGGARALMLDLRANPGGLLDAAVEVASRFLAEGDVVREVMPGGKQRLYSVLPRTRTDLPLVVLVDGGSASAAEIVAGALRDDGRAWLVGSRTYGKGSVQYAYQLTDGSSLHVTAALWLTPAGHEINGKGLMPDYEVAPGTGSADATLARGLDVLAAEAGLVTPTPVSGTAR